jgi:hypothetical protein
MDSIVGVTSFRSGETDGCWLNKACRGNAGVGVGRSSCNSDSLGEQSPLTIVGTSSQSVMGTCVIEVSCPASSSVGPGPSGEVYGNIEDVGVEEKTVCYKEHKGGQSRIHT